MVARGERLSLRLPAEPEALRSVRAALRGWLARAGASVDDARDVIVACNEACGNAIEHPRHPSEAALEVEGEILDGEVSVTIRDFGQWRPPVSDGARGRGFVLMEAFMESVEVRPLATGTEVRLRRRLAAGASV